MNQAAKRLCTTALAIAGTGLLLSAPPGRGPATPTGTVTGHVSFNGKPPGNPIIRMGMDPECADMNRGRQVIQEQALVTADGSVANVFVRLEGTFPASPVPSTPVVIDQRSCVYGRASSASELARGFKSAMTTICCTTCTARPLSTTASTSDSRRRA